MASEACRSSCRGHQGALGRSGWPRDHESRAPERVRNQSPFGGWVGGNPQRNPFSYESSSLRFFSLSAFRLAASALTSA